MDKYFLHLVSTAMGTETVPPYTYLFIDRHKKTLSPKLLSGQYSSEKGS